MTVPAAFVGVWVRRGLVAGEEPGAEPAEVVWLQGREWFVDVRVPLDGVVAGPATTDLGARAEAFGGRCVWAPIDGEDPDRIGTLTWHHEIDLAGGFAGGDSGVVEWISSTSFEERGSFAFEGMFRSARPGPRMVSRSVRSRQWPRVSRADLLAFSSSPSAIGAEW
jgi:hypothetical protein